MTAPFISDSPIVRFDQDRFHRTSFAEALATQIAQIDHTESIVVGLVGGWGTGKTSILNLARNSIERQGIKVLRFNPWFFSGTEQLVAAFFEELSAQLREGGDQKLVDIGKNLEAYGKTFAPLRSIPFIGSKIGDGIDALNAASSLTKSWAGIPTGSLETQKCQLENSLLSLERRIVITIDDVDRLRGDEIRDVMKLVRLAADLPNTTYVLLFDRERVEQSLSEDKVSGRAYLEKIINVTFNIPAIRTSELANILSSEIKRTVPQKPSHWDTYHYEVVFREILLKLIRSPRDIKRYINTLPMSVAISAQEVSPVDVLALEAIRIFLPDLFKQLSLNTDLLTYTDREDAANQGRARGRQGASMRNSSASSNTAVAEGFAGKVFNLLLSGAQAMASHNSYAGSASSKTTPRPMNSSSTSTEHDQKSTDKARFDTIIATSGTDSPTAERILNLLFPATDRFNKGFTHGEDSKRQWRRERRVAHPDVLAFYLDNLLPGGVVPLQKFLELYNLVQQPSQLTRELNKLSPSDLDTFLDRLIDYWSEIRHEHIEPLLQLLYSRLSTLPIQSTNSLEWGPNQKLSELTSKLFSRYRYEDEHDQLANAVVAKIQSLPMRMRFLRLVGRIHEEGQSKISESLETTLHSQILQELRTQGGASYEAPGIMYVIESLARHSTLREPLRELFTPVSNFTALLKGAQFTYESNRGPVPALQWGQLEASFGKEFLVSQVKRSLEEASQPTVSQSLEEASQPTVEPALKLAADYLNGYSEKTYDACSF